MDPIRMYYKSFVFLFDYILDKYFNLVFIIQQCNFLKKANEVFQ